MPPDSPNQEVHRHVGIGVVRFHTSPHRLVVHGDGHRLALVPRCWVSAVAMTTSPNHLDIANMHDT
ncbi:hypothetical protein ACFYVW_32595 [Streptomyces tendae]|uniref:hypothetical protein n=1 Tax=Streptomyces tendae TaxID=1932 RepID=UPI003689C8A2